MDYGDIGTNVTTGSTGTGTGMLGLVGTVIHDFGGAVLALLGVVVVVMFSYHLYKFATRKIKHSVK